MIYVASTKCFKTAYPQIRIPSCSDPELLWLWRRPVAAAPIRSLAWEPPYAAEAALEKKKKKKNLKEINTKEKSLINNISHKAQEAPSYLLQYQTL